MSQVRVLLDRKNCNVFYFLSRAKNDLYYGKIIKQIKRRSTNNDHRIASGIRLYLAFLYRRICYRYRIQHHQMDFQNPDRTDQMAWLRLKKDFSSLTKKRCRTHYTQCGLAFILRIKYMDVYGEINERRINMPKSCLNGYLTKGCHQCSDWNRNGIGCGTNMPIDWCPHFKKMYEEEEAKNQTKNSKDAK